MHTDAEFLGLLRGDGPGRFHFTVDERLGRLDGLLYGGAAIAISIAAAEEVSDRHALWMTTQFVSTVGQGADVSVLAEVLAPGRRTNQVRVTGTNDDGEVVFASLGATGHHRPDGLTGEFERAPVVSPPEDSDSWKGPFANAAKAAGIELPELSAVRANTGFQTVIEMRQAEILDHPDPGPGRMCLWVRRRDAAPITPALAAYMADMVPISIAQAGGALVGGTSLDNTIRIGSFVDSEWILLDLRPHLAAGDYGHGLAHVWSRAGHLMATASQTASLFHIDLTRPPWGPERS
ncbi:MAG: thioesterase family protein [Acidimicrobiia bacterium]|nr:thioesterase family protein [Acidimicrobiia bacterium]